MEQLIGKWEGKGVATFPSIQQTNYREQLIIEPHGDDRVLKVEQKTWRSNGNILHWEAGFIRPIDDDTYEWGNAQNNGRTEVLRGTITVSTSLQLILAMDGVAFSNDSRIKQSHRRFNVVGEVLEYNMSMATTAYPQIQPHLQSKLKRESL